MQTVIEERLQQIRRNCGERYLRQRIDSLKESSNHKHSQQSSSGCPVLKTTAIDRDLLTATISQNRDTHFEQEEIDSQTDRYPPVPENPAVNWAWYIGVKRVQYVLKENAAKVKAVRETEKTVSTDRQLLTTETIQRPKLIEHPGLSGSTIALNATRRVSNPQRETVEKVLSDLYGRQKCGTKGPPNHKNRWLHKGHPAINEMVLAARHFWWPTMMEADQSKCEACIPCKLSC